MKTTEKILCLSIAACFALVMSSRAQILVDSTNSPWVLQAGDPAVSDTSLQVNANAEARVEGSSLTLSGGITTNAGAVGTEARLIFSGGTVTLGSVLELQRKDEGDAYVEFSGADFSANNIWLGYGVSEMAGDNIDVVMSGGSVTTTGATAEMHVGSHNSATTSTPTVNWNQSGGDFAFQGKFVNVGLNAGSTATWTISGGTILQTRTGGWGLRLGGASGAGYGTFHVDGWWDDPGTATEMMWNGTGLVVNEQGTLKYTIHDANGVVPITVGGHSGANLLGSVDIDLDGYTPNPNDTFTLISSASNVDFGTLSLVAEDQGTWKLVDDGVNSGTLMVEYIPEPATLGLLVVGLLALTRRKRG